MMTKRDYELLASSLHSSFRLIEPEEKIGFVVALNAVSSALRKDNPRFDRNRFLAAVFEG